MNIKYKFENDSFELFLRQKFTFFNEEISWFHSLSLSLYIYIYIYIYIWIYILQYMLIAISLVGFVADQMCYNLESTQYLW